MIWAWKAAWSVCLGSRSVIGTSSGGSAMILGRPSTRWVSLATSCMLSRVRALAIPVSTILRCRAFSCVLNCARSSSRSACAYQMSRLVIPAKVRIACRYRATAAVTISRRSLPLNPLPRPATSRLAASRLTSHSHGPGVVSSKSLTSKTSRRSAEPKMPKFDRCASPQACTASPDTGVWERSLAIGSAAPR